MEECRFETIKLMKTLITMAALLMTAACGSKTPAGTLGKCIQSYQGLEFCTDYAFETTSSKDLTGDARNAAKATCGSGAWTDNESCSTTTAVGYCSFSVAEKAGGENYTLKYRAVYGPLFTGGKDNLKSLCEAANVAPISTVWTGL